jgi:dephospho-CoA kinase
MIVVGITGGIGSGKTTISSVFELLGVPVYYADDESKKIINDDTKVYDAILKTFGEGLKDNENNIDRKKLSEIVFKNPEKLKQLNEIVHPAVAIHFENWLNEKSENHYVLKEAAILFESGAYKKTNKVIGVIAPLELKIKRVLQRDDITREQIEQRVKNQLSDDEIKSRCNYIIYNDEIDLVIPQINNIHNQLMAL